VRSIIATEVPMRAREFEDQHPGGERLCRERVPDTVRLALLDAGSLERRVPLARAPGIESDVAALRSRK
jgi:hypothetical protein